MTKYLSLGCFCRAKDVVNVLAGCTKRKGFVGNDDALTIFLFNLKQPTGRDIAPCSKNVMVFGYSDGVIHFFLNFWFVLNTTHKLTTPFSRGL
jgi:hypothetical protein